ncbi:MAG TPA: DUF4097 family beta strand repeat-containing protein [Terriglobia bacterium]|nr:DUF4097 family beta strand repeat-containing protein [Terriglobia bacterium]
MKRHHGSIFWSLILISIGVLFLLKNLHYNINPWMIVAKYWPLLIIFWGLSKLFNYLSPADDPAAGQRSRLTGGDIVLLLFLLIVGSVVTKAVTHDFWPGHFGINMEETDFAGGDSSENSYNFTEEVSQPLTKKDRILELVNLYGSVEVRPHDKDEIKIQLEKRLHAKDEAQAKEVAGRLKIQLTSKSPGYLIATNRGDLENKEREGLKTNFSIWVPRNMTLSISNKYGPVTLEKVAGTHKIEDSYGDVTVTEVDGSLQIENKYGGVKLSGISGDCTVSSKYGEVELDTIGGKAKIDHSNGSVVLRKMRGAVELTHNYGKLDCSDLDSTLSVNGRYLEVSGNNIGGDVQISTSYRGVDLENVAGTVKVEAKHGDISIKDEQAPSKAITIDSEYGGVTITLPGESRFRFDGYSKFGKLVSEFDSIPGGGSTNFVEGTRIRGSRGEGGPMITVTTSYRDINLDAS